ncbi:hypothetical protein Rhe02_31830 [Rhizocola hellebori]|uniref:Activator of Hsp90 ATPase homologue 1/2-like C-terminal domain-containing protein n=1 Tax=Rhizocola hellebori TaxID=1392758 RepID=A0A8J3Q766_9ACTN|nr:SRPBCC family protein [Rhizocola hellebori]GIH05116.1 hypothetical protein Rhe02_31830 [Rhizocola hellebori]
MDRSSFTPSPLADVSHDIRDYKWMLVFVRDFRHPPEKVWAALTEPGQLSQWAPFTTDRDLSELGNAALTMIDGETVDVTAAQVIRAEPPRLLEYTWGEDLLRWELEPAGAGTRLTLRHTVQGREWLPKVAAGWHLCLDVAQHLLDGDPVGPIRGADAVHFGWNELNEAYERELKEQD